MKPNVLDYTEETGLGHRMHVTISLLLLVPAALLVVALVGNFVLLIKRLRPTRRSWRLSKLTDLYFTAELKNILVLTTCMSIG